MKQTILSILVFSSASCVTNNSMEETESKKTSKPVIHEAHVEKNPSFLKIEKNNPKAVQIMKQACNGRYQIISDQPNDPTPNSQIEVGLTKPVGKHKKTSPYIKYKCIHD